MGSSKPSQRASSNNDRLKAAGTEIMQGMGVKEERREKDALLVAAEAFADGSSSFEFDGTGVSTSSTAVPTGRRKSLTEKKLDSEDAPAAAAIARPELRPVRLWVLKPAVVPHREQQPRERK